VTSADFVPLIRSFHLLGGVGLGAILLFSWGLAGAMRLRNAEVQTGAFSWWEGAVGQTLILLVAWYVGSTIVDQVSHEPYGFSELGPSSFVASAAFASTLIVVGFRKFKGARWFLLFSFSLAMLLLGFFIQGMSWFMPRYLAAL
jgi:hypothetical protein